MKPLICLALLGLLSLSPAIMSSCSEDNSLEPIPMPVSSVDDIQGVWLCEEADNANVSYTYTFKGNNWDFVGKNRRSGFTWKTYGTFTVHPRYAIFVYASEFDHEDEPVTFEWAAGGQNTLVIGQYEYKKK